MTELEIIRLLAVMETSVIDPRFSETWQQLKKDRP